MKFRTLRLFNLSIFFLRTPNFCFGGLELNADSYFLFISFIYKSFSLLKPNFETSRKGYFIK